MKKILALLFALLASPVAAQTIPSGPWGSINYWGVGGLSQVLSPGLAGQCLQTQGVGSAPIWATCFTIPPQNANTILANVTTNFVAPQAVDINRVLDTIGYDIARPPAVESIIYKSNVGPLFNWQTLPPGPQGTIFTSGGPTNPPFWSPSPTQSNLASICQTVGALLYFDTPSNLWKCLVPGTAGQLLQTAGAGANPSWLTVTPATVGAVPITRSINTSTPLGGGGALSSDLTLTCSTCATTTNGGALSATTPILLSAAGVISMTNQGTTATVLHGNAAGNPSFGPVVISTDVSGLGTGIATALGVNVGTAGAPVINGGALGTPSSGTGTNLTGIPISTGISGLGTSVATTLGNALNASGGIISPTPVRAGDVAYWNGTTWTTLAGNNAGTNVLTENASGVPSWAAPGTGTVTSVTCASTVITITGTCYSAGQIVGTGTNDNATAGNFGEFVSSTATTGTLTSATATTITSISLTAGDWDISAGFAASGSSAPSVTAFNVNINTSGASTITTAGQAYNIRGVTLSDPVLSGAIGPLRVSLAGTTTYFLNTSTTYSTGTFAVTGIIRARRVR